MNWDVGRLRRSDTGGDMLARLPVMLLVAVAGCSFVFAGRPPEHPDVDEPVECSDLSLPLTDTAGALVSGYLAVDSALKIAGACEQQPPPPPSPDPAPGQWGSWSFGPFCLFDKDFYRGVALTSAIVAAAYVASAAWGYDVASSCRRAKREHAAAQRLAREEADARLREERDEEQRVVARAVARQHAIELTKQAAAAARADDCATVIAMDAQLGDSDPEYRDAVFVRDVASRSVLKRTRLRRPRVRANACVWDDDRDARSRQLCQR